MDDDYPLATKPTNAQTATILKNAGIWSHLSRTPSSRKASSKTEKKLMVFRE